MIQIRFWRDNLESVSVVSIFWLFLAVSLSLLLSTEYACSQVEPPDRRYLFDEESKTIQEVKSRQIDEIIKTDKPIAQDLDFNAPEIEFIQESNEIRGGGGVLISQDGMQVQAETGLVNMDTKDSELSGDVLFTWPEGEISCDSARLNLDTEIGDFESAELVLEKGDYSISTDELSKVSEFKFELDRSIFTTCQCLDGEIPWAISCNRAKIKQEGYAQTFDTTLDLWGRSVLYSPYFLFPVKQERSSGILAPEYGYSDEDGVKLDIPVFVVIDDYTDVTLNPFTENRTRSGIKFDFRKVFSRSSNIASRFVYSDESSRGDSLRGTNVEGLYDPEFDKNRFGGFLKQSWKNDSDALIPLGMVTDIHYVSDDLFLRELEDEDIGRRTARYTTSRMLFRSGYSDFLSTELSGEYNQSMQTDDDLIFQRLPELDLNIRKSFRPLGYNPYGIKLVSGAKFLSTDFVRKEGYDGRRINISPSVKVPYHFRNYFYGDIEYKLNQTHYYLDETEQPNDPTQEITGDNRTVPTFETSLSTAVERVYPVKPGGVLSTLTSLGARNQNMTLRRVKHVIEPTVRYSHIPDEYQDDLPLFDSLDRIREKNLVTYGITTSLLGRFIPPNESGEPITELTPEIEDLPVIGVDQPLVDLGSVDDFSAGLEKIQVKKGEVRQIASLSLRQTYDYKEDQEDNDPLRDPFSDIAVNLGVFPSGSFAMVFGSNYDAKENDFSSWNLATHFKDDRGDILRGRYTFVEDSVSQIEGNLQLLIVDQLRLGYYSRYDELEHEFIENGLALRLASSCDCWYFDVGYSDKINPDRKQGFIRFTFKGLGDIAQNIGLGQDD
jgi:LPS-assembly protein